MRFKKTFGLLGLAVVISVGSAVAPEDTCVTFTPTAIPTPIYVTVTVREAQESTVTVTVTAPAISIEVLPTYAPNLDIVNQDHKEALISYDSTVWETVYVTVNIDEPETSTDSGPLSFVVIDGTTSWLGETPTQGEPLVHATTANVVTVVPKPPNDPTTTMKSTAQAFISISSLNAAPGFHSYTTLTAPSLTFTPGGLTTAIIDGETLSWTITLSSSSHLPTHPPYGNSTISTLSAITKSTSSSILVSTNATGIVSTSSTVSTEVLNPVASLTSSVDSTTPSPRCGITGDFTLHFDDIPPLSIGNQSIDDVAPMPVFNPYQRFLFSDGFVVVPPPRVPYTPSSKPLLLEFIPNFTVNITDDDSGPNSREYGWSGDIGSADQGRTGCFGFNLYGASLGCDSRVDDCVFAFSGFRYDKATKLTEQVAAQQIIVPACSQLLDCSLTPIKLGNEFKNLDVIRANVNVGGLPKLWWVDDIQMGWYNNSCTMGACRQNSRLH